MTITEKVAYIKGLAEGLALDESSKEGKLFNAIIDVLDDLALTVADLNDQTDAIDEDLDALEEFVYEDADDEDDDFFCDGNCAECDEDCDDFDDGVYEIECPDCHETICFDESLFDDDDYELECPNCGAILEMEDIFDEEDGEDDEDKE